MVSLLQVVENSLTVSKFITFRTNIIKSYAFFDELKRITVTFQVKISNIFFYSYI